jgi:hypothetical protein
MKKITRSACEAFMTHRRFVGNNTVVNIDDNGTAIMSLFGNVIAKHNKDGIISVSNAGWNSNTTRERLNGLPGINIRQRKGIWYLNDKIWNGSWKNFIFADPIIIEYKN